MIGRGTFIASLTSAIALPSAAAAQVLSATRPFNLLILGDSIAWGQGLRPEHRWRELLVARLEATLNRPVREIAPQVHSGATIGLGDRGEIDQPGLYSPDIYTPGQEKPTLLDNGAYAGELPSSTPTVLAQLDALDAISADDPIDLVVVSAGINDVRIARFLNPLASEKFVDDLIDIHCRRHLTVLLDRIRVRCVDRNPACRVLVLSYYQMVSDQSINFPSVYDFVSAVFTSPPRSPAERRNRRVIVGIAEAEQLAQQLPNATQNTTVSETQQAKQEPDIVKRVAAAAKRFYDASEKAISEAVDDANRLAPPAFVHVTPRISTNEALYVAPSSASYLWAATIVGHKPPEPTDEVRSDREPLCEKLYGATGPALNECNIASIGHPNKSGASDGYFEALWAAIVPGLAQTPATP
jgi:lysophospholipase L1-like esterase